NLVELFTLLPVNDDEHLFAPSAPKHDSLTIRTKSESIVYNAVVVLPLLTIHDYEIFLTYRGSVGDVLAIGAKDDRANTVVCALFLSVDYNDKPLIHTHRIGNTSAVWTEHETL